MITVFRYVRQRLATFDDWSINSVSLSCIDGNVSDTVEFRLGDKLERTVGRRLMAITLSVKRSLVISWTGLSPGKYENNGFDEPRERTVKYLPRQQTRRQVADLSYRKTVLDIVTLLCK